MEILVGTNNLKSGGKYYRAEVFKIHEDYGKGGMKRLGDIAVIRIADKISFNEEVQPIELYRDEVPGGVEASFAGWGKTKTSDTTVTDQLKIINTKVVSLGNCRRTTFGANAEPNHICAFAKLNVGACDGDSGGPLVWNNTVVGVASFVRPCARGVPDIFTSVPYYYEWIMEKTMTESYRNRVTEEAITEEIVTEQIRTEEITTEEFTTEEIATEETITENTADVKCSKSSKNKCTIM